MAKTPAATTIREWPPGSDPRPVRLGALDVARSMLGEREQGGPNMGPIVDWSLAGITSRSAAGDAAHPAGWARWCAFFVSQCFLRELTARGKTELARTWLKDFASGSCSTLWAALERAEWTVYREDADPQPGDLVFYGEVRSGRGGLDFHHVDLVEQVLAIAGTIGTIGGNSSDRVSRSVRNAESKIIGFARVPW